MAGQTEGQKDTIERVMHEYKHGELKSGNGRKVKSRKQAIAIGLNEAGASHQQSSADNRKRYRHTKKKERSGDTAKAQKEGAGPTKAELYERARKKNVPGRSKMSKAELEQALG